MADILEFNTKESKQHPLVGRLLLLDVTKSSKFQCYGFFLCGKLSMSIVPDKASFNKIQEGIDEGILIDITDNAVTKKGITKDGNTASAVYLQETDKGATITKLPDGRTCLTIDGPKEAELTSELDQTTNINGMSRIIITDI